MWRGAILFDAAVRPWSIKEIQSLQSWIDRCYRHVWSSKTKPPPIEMQERGVNMQDLRNILKVKTLRWKIEKRDPAANRARPPHGQRATGKSCHSGLVYWPGELAEGPGEDAEDDVLLAQADPGSRVGLARHRQVDRGPGLLERRSPAPRMAHLLEWEKRQGKQTLDTAMERNRRPPEIEAHVCPEWEKTCKSQGGLRIHIKRMHTTPSVLFFLCQMPGGVQVREHQDEPRTSV